MIRFFFDVHEHGSVTLDDDGRDYADAAAAEAWACQIASGMMTAELAMATRKLDGVVEIRTDDGIVHQRIGYGFAIGPQRH